MKARNPSTGQWEDIYVKALDSFPVGVIVEYPTTDSAKLPTGYMFCDGSAISRTEYSELFSLIGTSFGAGDGSTTFNIPSKAGLVTAGIKSSDTDFDTIGETLGEKTHTLTVNELAAHGHAVRNNMGGIDSSTNTGTGSWGQKLSYTASGATAISSNAYAAQNTGSNIPHNNIQPTQVSNFIIKVKPTRVLASTVVNAYSESQNSTYSCDYVNNMMSYSTIEVNTGKKWIDGKDIYRKTIQSSAVADGTVLISNAASLVNSYGTGDPGTGNQRQLPYYEIYNNQGYACRFYKEGSNIKIDSKLAGSSHNASLIATLEYTKTS